MGMMSDAAGAWLTDGQLQPVSIVQVELQPSPDSVLPSSHCSCGNFRPSPHTAVHVPPLQRGSTPHQGEQPSYGLRLPSSHCSKPCTRRSPHTSVEEHGAPGTWHTKNGSRRHVELQPSPPMPLPSSHCSPSPAWITPSPQ